MTNRSEQHRLISGWLAGTLTKPESERLTALARNHPELRAEMASLLGVDRLLKQQSLQVSSSDVFAAELVARLSKQSGDPSEMASRVVRRIQDLQPISASRRVPQVSSRQTRPSPGAWLGLAAAFLIIGALAALILSGPNRAQAGAMVSGAEAVVWADGQPPIRVGGRIRTDAIQILGGFISVRFPSGATVLLEGPAKLRMLGDNKARLEHGKAVAEVPTPATGFIMESPDAHILDLGTKFGMRVGASEGTEVHVLQGKVEAASLENGTAQPLIESEAVRISSGGTVALPADQTLFLTDLPPIRSGPLHFIRWSLDEGTGEIARSSGSLAAARSEGVLKRLSGTPGGAQPQWNAGRFGAGLRFDGADGYVVTGCKGIGGGSPRTVALWVRVPRDWEPKNGFALVSWGTHVVLGGVWQVSVNPEGKDGPVGRLRVGVQGAQVIGNSDLRDGQWHHVAAVLYNRGLTATTTQILLYVDGQLEGAERRAVQAVQTKLDDASAIPVTFGRNSDSFPPDGRYLFRGDMDEIYIVDAALSQSEIQRLASENRLPADPSLARN